MGVSGVEGAGSYKHKDKSRNEYALNALAWSKIPSYGEAQPSTHQ
jgi:hypothetical protein